MLMEVDIAPFYHSRTFSHQSLFSDHWDGPDRQKRVTNKPEVLVADLARPRNTIRQGDRVSPVLCPAGSQHLPDSGLQCPAASPQLPLHTNHERGVLGS
jgi:hypothetical protein